MAIRFDYPEIQISQNIPDAICVMGLDFTIQCWNKGAEDIFGWKADEIIGKHISTIIPPEIARQEIDHCVNTLNTLGKMALYESVRLTKDGRHIPIELSAVALKTGDTVTGYATIMRDITERKRMEDELKESRENLRTIFNSSSNAIFVHDLDGTLIDVNEKMLEMYKVGYDEALRLSIAKDYSSPDNPVDMLPGIWKYVLAGAARQFEWKARRPHDGSLFPVEVYLKKITLRKKDVILAIVRDMTEQRIREEALRLTQFSVDRASVSVFLVDGLARILYVNDQTCQTLGYSRQELETMTVHDLDPDFPPARWPAHWSELKQKGSLHFESRHRKKDGKLIPVDLSVNFIAFGGLEYNWAFATDITERKQNEKHLRESEERYRAIVETSADWIWEINRDGLMIYNNPAVERILGYAPADLAGKSNFEYMFEEDREKGKSIFARAVREHAGWTKDLLRWKHRNGSVRYIESNAVPVFTEAGDLIGFRGVDRDVTEIRIAQEKLQWAYGELEQKVQERTRELAKANDELKAEVTERRHAVDLLRRAKMLADALNRIDNVIHSTLNFDEIMRRVVSEATEAIEAEGAAIGLMQDEYFHIRYVNKMAKSLEGWSVPLHQLTGVSMAAESGDTIAFNDAVHDNRLNRGFIRKWGIQSMLVSPLLVRKRPAGAIVFYSFSNPVVFREEHIDFGRKLAASVSPALDNARLYEALEESRRLSESRFTQLQTIYETAPIGLCFLDRDKRYVSINQRLAEINDLPIEQHLGKTIREIVKDQAAARIIEENFDRVIETGQPIENREIVRNAATGLTVLANYYPVRDRSGEIIGLNIVVQDITERKRTEEAVRSSERLLKALLNSIPDMAWLKDRDSRFILVNQPFADAVRRAPDQLTGKTDLDVWPHELAEKYRADDREVIESGRSKRVEEPMATPDGPTRWIETIKTPISNEKGAVVGTAGISRDTTERRRMEEEIRHLALHDPLTGLPNRRLFLDILKLEMAQARRHKTGIAILFLDLDRFKEINDTLGHALGDRLLKHVASQFRATVRQSDTVARIGGDEFNILLADITRPEDVTEIAAKIVESLREPVVLNGHTLHISTSVGVSIYPDDSAETETLLRYADIAMYDAKEHGRNTFRYYNPSIHARSIERMKLERWLGQAIRRGELSILYQPQIEINSGRIRFAEALVRWNHPERGLLEPKEFIPLAEETGFITKIDEWVLRNVCAQVVSWKKAGIDSFCATVNLSARRFQSPDLVPMIVDILRETGMPPECLDLEVTEHAAMSDVGRSAATLRELRSMGVHISIDDFGTGYSSLNYLKRLPIERLKIDKSFVRDIARDADDRIIISAVTSLAHKMGIRAVAEGVETNEQLEFLRQSECDEAQGFLFSRPVPPEKFKALVESRK